MTVQPKPALHEPIVAAINAVPYCGLTLAEARRHAAEAWGFKRGVVQLPGRRRRCLLAFAGQRCLAIGMSENACWGCSRQYLDHVSYWGTMSAPMPTTLVAHTYGDAGEAADDALLLGLRYEVSPTDSWHAPGRTVLLALSRT